MSDPSPVVASPSILRMVLVQLRVELLLSLRRGESILVTVIVPTILLLFFGSVAVLPGGQQPIGDLLPGILALAVMSTAMVSLGIATAFERHYRVLKRLGGSPLPRIGLLVAKLGAVLVTELAQVLLLLAIARLVFGWRPAGSFGLALLALLLGTAAFGGLGLWMAGTLRAEATLAVANGLYLVFLLLGGVVFPRSALPGALAGAAGLLPSAVLADTLRASLDASASVPFASLALLAGWALVASLAAARTFRWE